MPYPKLIETAIEQLSKLPGVGRRSAERMAFWVLKTNIESAQGLADSITELKRNLRFCKRCNNLSDEEYCHVCLDKSRERALICVVEDPKDVIAIEKTGYFKGLYHVLLGTISPADGRGPDDIKVKHLLSRIEEEKTQEIVIATDADNEGEMTALYIIKQLKPLAVKVSRIGMGIPVGSSVEFADASSLSASLASRREIL